jgi:hypothetical protein
VLVRVTTVANLATLAASLEPVVFTP